jgi:hypothetical protein
VRTWLRFSMRCIPSAELCAIVRPPKKLIRMTEGVKGHLSPSQLATSTDLVLCRYELLPVILALPNLTASVTPPSVRPQPQGPPEPVPLPGSPSIMTGCG